MTFCGTKSKQLISVGNLFAWKPPLISSFIANYVCLWEHFNFKNTIKWSKQWKKIDFRNYLEQLHKQLLCKTLFDRIEHKNTESMNSRMTIMAYVCRMWHFFIHRRRHRLLLLLVVVKLLNVLLCVSIKSV